MISADEFVFINHMFNRRKRQTRMTPLMQPISNLTDLAEINGIKDVLWTGDTYRCLKVAIRIMKMEIDIDFADVTVFRLHACHFKLKLVGFDGHLCDHASETRAE